MIELGSYILFYLGVRAPDFAEMEGEGVNGVESGGAGADALAEGIGDGEGDSGGGDAAHALGAGELPVVELGLLGAGRREDDGVPRGGAGGVADGEAETVP